MKTVRIRGEKKYIELFLALPKMLYAKDEIIQSEKDERAILEGTCYINSYAKFTPFLVVDDDETKALARCIVTEYNGDASCYFGFFECIEDTAVFELLMQQVEDFALEEQYSGIEGPLDACLWMRYRFKTNRFDEKPYLGEPYNKAYYPAFFKERGYAVKEKYVSNDYRALPKEGFSLEKYESRWKTFVEQGYEIRSPRKDEWDKCIVEIYEMIKALYSNFLTYHEISREDFVSTYNSYRSKVDMNLIKMAYYKGQAAGFFMGAPDYGNISSRKISPRLILDFLATKRKPERYVLLYMGVMPEHRGMGKALIHSIMAELAKRGTPSIGSLIRSGNTNYDYAKEYIRGRFEYEYYEKKFTIKEYLKRGEMLWGKSEYIIEQPGDNPESHTFSAFAEDVRRLSKWLLKKGYQGKNIAIYGRNSYPWMVCDMAVMGFVGTCFPVDVQYGIRELTNILSAGKIDLFVYDDAKSQVIKELIEERKTEAEKATFLSFSELCAAFQNEAPEDDIPSVSPYATAKVIFTSGTSATPKGVMLSQSNMFSNWRTLFERTPMKHDDSIYLVLPLNHVYAGIAAFLYTILSGMKIYLGSPGAEACIKDMSRLKPTVFIGVPLLTRKFRELQEADGTVSLNDMLGGRLKYFYCGGTRIEQELKDAFVEADVPFIEAYGLSETSSVVALDIVGKYRKGSTGKVMECLKVKLADVDESDSGELLVKGGSLMSGYYGLSPEENSKYIDAEGYFHTGDLARIDEDGYLYILGRKRQLLITDNGKNVYPQEVEDLVCKNESVTRATLYLQNNRLHLKVWYHGDLDKIKEFLEKNREELPGYMAYDDYECIEDVEGSRLK